MFKQGIALLNAIAAQELSISRKPRSKRITVWRIKALAKRRGLSLKQVHDQLISKEGNRRRA